MQCAVHAAYRPRNDRLPQNLEPTQLHRLRQQLGSKERLRREAPEIQLHRLILSDRRWGDPRYLSEQDALPTSLDLPRLQRLAEQLTKADNRVQLRLLPDRTAGAQP